MRRVYDLGFAIINEMQSKLKVTDMVNRNDEANSNISRGKLFLLAGLSISKSIKYTFKILQKTMLGTLASTYVLYSVAP